MVDHGYFSANHYLADVELGNEVIDGTGELWLREFQVNIN